jgi:hypothetical protein
MVFGGTSSNYIITMVGVMYWALEVFIHYSCENFGIAQ